MKKIVTSLSAIVKLTSTVTGFVTISSVLPAQYGAYAALAFGLASSLEAFARVVGDAADDGKLNKSFNPK